MTALRSALKFSSFHCATPSAVLVGHWAMGPIEWHIGGFSDALLSRMSSRTLTSRKDAKPKRSTIALAEGEALEYADNDDEYLDLAQAFKLFDEPEHGAEVFSLMRSSRQEPDAYLDTFFDTGTERAQVTEDA